MTNILIAKEKESECQDHDNAQKDKNISSRTNQGELDTENTGNVKEGKKRR